MGKSSSVDLRVRIVGEIERGQSCRAAARRFGVAASTAVRLAQRKAQTGSVAPAREGLPGVAVAAADPAWLYRQKNSAGPPLFLAKPIALTLFVPGGCGECIVNRG